MTPDDIKTGLKTQFFGHKVYAYKQTRSTNDVALRLGANGAPEGALVIAEYQSAGRGQLGRSWLSPPGSSILASIIVRPAMQLTQIPMITLLAAAAVARSIRYCTQLPAMIKWPNDVVVDGKKVCGILTEMGAKNEQTQFLAVGIGINVNIPKDSFPIAIKKTAISLNILLGYEISRIQLLQTFLLEFENRYVLFRHGDFVPIISEVRQLSSILGCPVRVECDENIIVGQAVDINEDGALLVRNEMGMLRKVMTGTVTGVRNSEFGIRN